MEFVSPAMNGDYLFKNLRDVCGEITKRDYKINASCGLHVHINCACRGVEFLKKVTLLYYKFEKYLFEVVPKSRRKNRYCKSLNLNMNTLERVKTMLEFKQWFYDTKDSYDLYDYSTMKYYDGRYFAFNLHSYFYRGTIEVRHHSGTTSALKIINWIKINLALFERAQIMSYEEIKEMKVTTENFNTILNDYGLIKYIRARKKMFKKKEEKENV